MTMPPVPPTPPRQSTAFEAVVDSIAMKLLGFLFAFILLLLFLAWLRSASGGWLP